MQPSEEEIDEDNLFVLVLKKLQDGCAPQGSVEIPFGETCKVQGGLEVEVALQPQINFPFNSPVTVGHFSDILH